MRLRSSCFSFAVSKAGLQDFAVLRHVGVMCNDRVDLKEAMVSPTLCPRIALVILTSRMSLRLQMA